MFAPAQSDILINTNTAIGIAAVIGTLLLLIQLFSYIFKRASNKETAPVKDNSEEIRKLQDQLSILIGHHESEVRFRTALEGKINNLEKAILLGNGKPSLMTRMALVENDMERLLTAVKDIK